MPVPDFEGDLVSILDHVLRVVGFFCELCASQNYLPGLVNGILVHQMIVQGIWWDEVPLKALFDDSWMPRLKQWEIHTLPQVLSMRPIPTPLRSICDRILLYRIAFRRLSEDGLSLTVVLGRVSGTIGSKAVSPHYMKKDVQFLYVIVGHLPSGSVICHRRVALTSDEISVRLRCHRQPDANSWIYIMSECYVGIDQMYPAVGDLGRLPRASMTPNDESRPESTKKEKTVSSKRPRVHARPTERVEKKTDEETKPEIKPEPNPAPTPTAAPPPRPKPKPKKPKKKMVTPVGESGEKQPVVANSGEEGVPVLNPPPPKQKKKGKDRFTWVADG
jgi:hypothetical protein